MIPARSEPDSGNRPIFNAPPATLWTCAGLVVIFVLYNLLDRGDQNWVLSHLAFVSSYFDAQFSARGPGLSPLIMATLVSHALLHANFMHLALNVGFLLAFGSVVERRFGALGFALIFIVCAAAGALTELAFVGARPIVLIGASDAVYGMMGAFVAVMVRRGGVARNTALNFVVVILVINLLLAMLGVSDFLAGGAQVAWRAHIGGFAAGVVLALLLQIGIKPASRR